jgi:hypothetical protein
MSPKYNASADVRASDARPVTGPNASVSNIPPVRPLMNINRRAEPGTPQAHRSPSHRAFLVLRAGTFEDGNARQNERLSILLAEPLPEGHVGEDRILRVRCGRSRSAQFQRL